MLDEMPPRRLSVEALPQFRADALALLLEQRPNDPVFDDVEATERFIPGPEGAPDVRTFVYLPKAGARPLPVLVWIHGGGYVLGSLEGEDVGLKTLVREVGCAVVSVDYRLAPEAQFPANVEDCYAALRWAHAQPEFDSARVAIGGSSAGGGLAAGLGLLARDRAELPVAFQLLLVPMIDDRTVTHLDPHPHTGEFTWTRHNNRVGWTSLLGVEPGSEGVSPYAAAARAESLAGLPPTYIATGSLDLFLEEDMEYARRLTREGVATELHVYPGAYHGFSRAAGARVSKVYRRDWFYALQRAFEAVPAPVGAR